MVKLMNNSAAGVHYIVPRTDENLIFGKRDKTGIFAAKTKSGRSLCFLTFEFRMLLRMLHFFSQNFTCKISAVLIACYEGENAAGAEARVAVEKLAQYLLDSGY